MKITLSNLADATEQQVFDQVAKHLLKQGKRSYLDRGEGEEVHGMCAYHSDDGLFCAAGCLIADDEYESEFEGNSWLSLTNRPDITKKHLNIIGNLQYIHDEIVVDGWEEELQTLAARSGLEWTLS